MNQREKLKQVLESLQELVADPQCDFGPSYEMMKVRQQDAIRIVKQMIKQEQTK